MIRKALFKMSRGLYGVSLIGAVAFFAAVLGLVLFQVVARYVFQTVPAWTAEAARYSMVWSGLLGAASAYKANRDPRLLNPPQKGPPGWTVAATVLRGIAVLVFLGPVLYHSPRFLERHWDRTAEAMGVSTVWVTAAVPLAILLIFIHLAARIAAPGESGAGTGTTGDKR